MKLVTVPVLTQRIAVQKDLIEVQEKLAGMADAVQHFDAKEKRRWNDLRAEEARLWRTLQALNTN